MPTSAELSHLAQDSVWLDKQRYSDAENQYFLSKANPKSSPGKSTLVDEIARARQQIAKTLQCSDSSTPGDERVESFQALATENTYLRKSIDELTHRFAVLEYRVQSLEFRAGPEKLIHFTELNAPAKKVEASNNDDDDDVDLFGSEEEDNAEQEKLKQARVQAYQEKKSKKPALIAKSNIILDVKPWDDETDMKEMEKQVRAIQMDGLIWGASKLAPLAYGIHKLQISCVVEDDKVSVDELQEKITENEDLVQSVDIAAFNKV